MYASFHHLFVVVLTLLAATSSAAAVAVFVQIVSCLSVLSLQLPVDALYSNNPSTNWNLSQYYYDNSSDVTASLLRDARYSNHTVCMGAPYFELLNEQAKGFYGRSTGIISAHNESASAVYFGLYFVTPAENICVEHNGTFAAHIYYLSLVAVNRYDRDPNHGQVLWIANPQKPVTKNACLLLNDSDLALVDYDDNIGSSPEAAWQISTGERSVSLAISFEGNIVLFSNTTDTPYMPLWESFRYPTDTLMVLQVLENTSTLSVNSSFGGSYTMAIRNGRLVLYANFGQPVDEEESSSYGYPYWSMPSSAISADGITFAAFCWDSINQLRLHAGSDRSSDHFTEYKGMVSPEFCSTIPNNNNTTMQITGLDQSKNATYATFLRLDSDGDLRAYTVDNTTYPGSNTTWRSFYSVFNSTPCDLPLYCGFYGMCDPQKRTGSYCTCNYSDYPKLVFADASDPNQGCKVEYDGITQLWDVLNASRSAQASDCAINDNLGFCTSNGSQYCWIDFILVYNAYHYSLDFTTNYQGVHSLYDCWDACSRNCSCTASFWNESTGSCFLILGRLGTIQQRDGTMQAFIKLVRVPSPVVITGISRRLVAFLLAASIVFVCICIFAGAYWRRRALQMSELQKKERFLLLSLLDVDCASTEKFTWKQMQKFTNGFSYFIGGGGFGAVFRGTLADGTTIAVKKLDEDGSQGQGNKEFIAEVSILSRIHHAHLVRLIGFCLEGKHRLLVYEYMENGSLDAWLFQTNLPPVLLPQQSHNELEQIENDMERERLCWKTRFLIAMGTAKGLAYLHDECEQRVIHMDLKPQNILLGPNFHAKISDFGMSKRTARDQTAVMTVMRGTPGYLAPEWLLDCAITEKCDVYSFGIVLLELVSGKKVKDLRAIKQMLGMRALRESVMLDFLDESLRNDRNGSSDVDETEVVRMVEVALLSVRTDPAKRPEMSRVVWMLEGKEELPQHVYELEDEDDDDDAMRLMQQYQVHSLTSMMESSTNVCNSDVNNYTQCKKYIELQKQHMVGFS